ncbi:MAG: HAMP domain-containing histidine kinase, partial [Pedobacter sp.]
EQNDPIAAISSKVQPEELPLITKACQDLISGTSQGSISVCLKHPQGARWLSINPIIAYQEGKKLILGTITDITAEVINNQTIIGYADKKNSILHMLAHDLRGPLGIGRNVLKSMGTQLQDTVLIEKTENIVSILENAISMINDLVTREFLETTEVMLSKKRIDLVRKIGDYVQECRRTNWLTERIFEFNSNAPSIFLPVDEAKFIQVINNLISNALKFTRPGGRISIELIDFPSTVEMRFSDDGIGIPKELMPELFRKFTPAGRTGLMGEPTVGLGMSIINTIISWHNGTIRCESEEGKGTTFLISIPKK